MRGYDGQLLNPCQERVKSIRHFFASEMESIPEASQKAIVQSTTFRYDGMSTPA